MTQILLPIGYTDRFFKTYQKIIRNRCNFLQIYISNTHLKSFIMNPSLVFIVCHRVMKHNFLRQISILIFTVLKRVFAISFHINVINRLQSFWK